MHSTSALTATRIAIRIAAFAIAALAFGVHAADSGSGTMVLRAVIQKRALVTGMSVPAEVRVSQEDVARGYVDVPAPVQVQVRSNSADGYLLTFELDPALARRAQIGGLGSPVQLGNLPGSVRQPAPGHGMATGTVQLHIRFELASSTGPGVYDWPLRVTAEPL